MLVRIRCIYCGRRFRENESILGQSVRCPACGKWLKTETGPTLSGGVMLARVSAGEPPVPNTKRPARTQAEAEKSPFWRDPALRIGLIAAGLTTIVAAFIISLFAVRHATEPPERPSKGNSASALAGGSHTGAARQTPKTKPSAGTASGEQKPAPAPGSPDTGTPKPPSAPITPLAPPRNPAPPKPTSQPNPKAAPSEVGSSAPPAGASTPASGPAANAPDQEPLSAQEIFRRASPAVVQIVVLDRSLNPIGLGSGFFVRPNGMLVTNHHVVRQAAYAAVVLPTKAVLFVEGILAVDEQADLAVLQVNGTDLPYLRLAPQKHLPAIGSRVFAIGSPAGLGNTLSEGLVSGLRAVDQGVKLIQTTAPISPGSSGGPLLAADGAVVGVTSATLAGPALQNLNFAVPSDNVHRLLEAAKKSKPRPLASAGGTPFDAQAGAELQEAWNALREERWHDAVEILRRLRRRYPDNPQVYCLLGLLHLHLGNDDLALEAFRHQVQLAPNSPFGHCGMGMAYHSLGRHVEAVSALRRAVRIDPDFWLAHLYLGMSFKAMGRPDAAIDACKKAVRLKPDCALAYYCLGLAYLEKGDRHRAVRAYSTLLHLDPDLARRLRVALYGP